MLPAVLEVADHAVGFRTARGSHLAVDGVDLRLKAGEALGIVGESGSGKSVLVRSVMDLLPPNAFVEPGSIVRLWGRDVTELTQRERRLLLGRRIAMVFQDPMTSLNPVKRVGSQITEPIRYHLGVSRHEARDRALHLLERVGIPRARERLEQFPHELSGGTRQRVSIAIALSCDPDILVADEPTTALDVTVQRQVLELLNDLRRERSMAMILISHDLAVVAGNTDRVVVMYAGRIVESADRAALFASVGHPYTRALLNAIPAPTAGTRRTRLTTIPGQPPLPGQRGDGCSFEPRCGHATDLCRHVAPTLLSVSPGHDVACHHALGLLAGDAAAVGGAR